MKDLLQLNPELKQILAELKNEFINATRPANEIILDDVDLRNLLKVSPRTTANYRTNGQISYSQHGNGKIFYIYSDVLKFINDNKIDPSDLNLNIPL